MVKDIERKWKKSERATEMDGNKRVKEKGEKKNGRERKNSV